MQLVIADAAVELAPRSWLNDRNIKKYHDKYGRMPLIDGSIHQHLLQNQPKDVRNDRPDILHFGLLTALGYEQYFDKFELFFTVDDTMYAVDRKVRLPRSQPRFYGIIANLLSGSGRNPYLFKMDKQLETFNSPKIFFSRTGTASLDTIKKSDTFVFGGFAYGSLRPHISPDDYVVSLSNQALDLWTAISHFLTGKIYNVQLRKI